MSRGRQPFSINVFDCRIKYKHPLQNRMLKPKLVLKCQNAILNLKMNEAVPDAGFTKEKWRTNLTKISSN